VQSARQTLLDEVEAQPVQFLERTALDLHERARTTLAAFLHADPDGLGFVSNATEAIDAVLASHVDQGDSILIGDQAYGAVVAACEWVAGAPQVRRVEVPLPASPSSVVDAWRAALATPPALAIVDHITSGTALVHPVGDIVACCRDAGVPVLVDGAHAPGMVDLHIDDIDADWYAGNLHKWIGAPSGAGFLWTAQAHRDRTRPLAISHDVADGYLKAFCWQGTRDVTPWLVVPDAIEAVESRWGWNAVRRWQQEMACWAGGAVSSALGTDVADGAGGAMTGAMVSVRLPATASKRFSDRFELRETLAREDRIELAIDQLVGSWWARFSFGLWNTPEDVHRATAALRRLLD